MTRAERYAAAIRAEVDKAPRPTQEQLAVARRYLGPGIRAQLTELARQQGVEVPAA